MSEGISHVLYVIDGRFTVNEINTFNMINDSIFKSGVLDYVTIVRTKFSNFRNEEECEKSMKQTREGNKLVAEIVNSCNGVVHKTPSEDVRKHFEKATEVDGRDRKTPRQKCNYCGNDIIDLIDRLKDHSIECKSLPEDLKLIYIIIKCLNFYCKICIT
ncbi:unnamed protein product [Rhizophagus irregularis]|nr:unnamed protein product [Rhizophagus irregularis]